MAPLRLLQCALKIICLVILLPCLKHFKGSPATAPHSKRFSIWHLPTSSTLSLNAAGIGPGLHTRQVNQSSLSGPMFSLPVLSLHMLLLLPEPRDREATCLWAPHAPHPSFQLSTNITAVRPACPRSQVDHKLLESTTFFLVATAPNTEPDAESVLHTRAGSHRRDGWTELRSVLTKYLLPHAEPRATSPLPPQGCCSPPALQS